MGEVKVLKGGSELSPEQQEFVRELRSLVDRALAGEIVALIGCAITVDEDDDEDYEQVSVGFYCSDALVMAALEDMRDTVKECWLAGRDDEE